MNNTVSTIFSRALRKIGLAGYRMPGNQSRGTSEGQELKVYWTAAMAEQLENWGKDHAWIEIECLLVNCRGKVLDIACGTGVNIVSLSRFEFLDMYGCDISDMLIDKAREKGIDPERLKVVDATKTCYLDNEFDYSYSIGSLEHFTEDGIDSFLSECKRYTSKASFHQVPVSRKNIDCGWIRRNQCYFNNSIEWWFEKFHNQYNDVQVINSGWNDKISVGKWFICRNT